MTSGRISLACAVLLSAVYLSTGQSGVPIDDNIEDAVYLNSTRQVVTFVSALTNIGDKLTTILINFNQSVVSGISHASYSLYGSGRLYVSIDHNGVVTLKQQPRVTTYTIPFSVLVNARAVGKNGTFTVFLSGQLVLRSVGIVRFNDSTISTSIRAFLPVRTQIYNLSKNVEVESKYIKSFSLSYFGYSSYFYFAYDGIVTIRRELSPSTYSARVRMNYQVTFKNGTLLSSYEYIYFRVTVQGCRLSEEGSVEWPTMGSCQRAEHTCTKYHPLLKGGTVARHCDSAGKSSVPDFSRCCVQQSGSSPFALVWITYTGVSSQTYLGAVETIKRSVSSLFRSSATAVSLFSAYRSNRYYGFSMSFNVTLRSDVTISTVRTALRLLKSYRRFGLSYLRYESESRGIRAFMPSSCCQPYNYMVDDSSSVDFIRIPFCCGTPNNPCTCTTSSRNCAASAYNAGRCRACSNPSLKSPDPMCAEETTPIPTTAPIPHNRTCIKFNKSSYSGRMYIGSSTRGTNVLTVGTVACDSTLIKEYTAHYGLNGYYADYFDIGKQNGILTTSGLPLRVQLYSFYVSAFIDITYKNGTRIQNFTETNVRVDVNGGITLNQTRYTVSADVESEVNTSSILDLGAEVIIDPTYVKKNLSLTFTRVSNSYFGITKEGHIYPRVPLIANINYYLTAYYTYTIIDINDQKVTYSSYVGLRITAKGCRQEEGGSHVWPLTHACGIVNVSCSHFDSSFDNYGHVRRQCTKDGVWLTPDLSQCRLKAGSPPFVLLWFTFSSVYTRHWNDIYTPRTLGELRSYMSGFPVTSITVHHNKESKVLYGFVQSFKAELRPGSTLNGTLLQVLNDTITTARRIGGRTKRTLSYTAGVLGVTTSDRCIQYSIATNVTDYTPVCVLSDTASCTCKKDAPLVNSMCCTNEGQINETLDMCAGPEKTIIVPEVKQGSITMSLKRSGPSVLISWTVSGGDTPDYYEVVYRSNDHEQRLMVNKTESSVNVTGLLPGTSYTVSVRGYYRNGESISNQQVVWIEDISIFIFQILFSGITTCPQLKANMDNLRRMLVNTVRAGCQCSFSLDRLALTVDQCPYGKPSDNMAMMRGWIYDTSDSPGLKYFPYMQKMASKDVSITAGDMKLNAAQVCAFSCSPNQTPPTSAVISAGDSTTAGTVIGIIIGIVGCVLLAVIFIALVVLILRFKNGKNQQAATLGKSPASAMGVSLSETTKMEDDDDAELQKDF